jgi:NAD(P)-dependent dehydrogenase (short-subunit alcohol dehydrogenase family)
VLVNLDQKSTVAGQGIGREIACLLKQHGAQVVLACDAPV